MNTLYDKLGGEKTVEATVDILHDKILNDPEISHYFSQTDRERLKRKHQQLLTDLFGGGGQDSLSATLEGLKLSEDIIAEARNLANAHTEPPATESGEKVLLHLQQAMRELRIPDALIDEALELTRKTQHQLLKE